MINTPDRENAVELIDEAVASNEAASYVNLRGVAVDSAASLSRIASL